MLPKSEIPPTPAERRRERVRLEIIEAAERVFARVGEEGLSIRRLAEEIDYSPAAIYKYFGSKEELLDELKEAFFERLLERASAMNQTDLPFDEKARGCMSVYISTAFERPHHYMAAFSGIAPKKDACASIMVWEEFLESRKGRAFSILINMVSEGQAEGYFDPALDPVLAAKSVWASLHGIAQLMIHLPQFPTRDASDQPGTEPDFIQFHINLIFRSLSKEPEGLSMPAGKNGIA